MTLIRTSTLGVAGLLLLQLTACSADPARKNKSAPDERLDTNTVGSDASSKFSNGDSQPAADCDWHKGDPIVADKIKWQNTLERPRVFQPTNEKGDEYTVTVLEKEVQMLPEKCYPKTKVFAYGGRSLGYGETEPKDVWTSPGPTFEMKHGAQVKVKWVNGIEGRHLFPMDPTLHWANPDKLETPKGPFDENFVNPAADSPVPIVTHVHGLEVAPDSDGSPDAWFTWDPKKFGSEFKKDQPSVYPNSQPATTLWYHDHALGVTRLNVYAGLAGMYIIRDKNDPIAALLPDEAHEMPLVIQDKTFDANGQLVYTTGGGDHPYWSSSFTGETMVVNGKVMPKMEVERTRYRFRVLNGGNNKDIHLTLPQLPVSEQFRFTIVGTDGGYLPTPVGTDMLMLTPGERADIVIDFSSMKPGDTAVLKNGEKEVVQFKALDAEVKPTCALQAPPAKSADAPNASAEPKPLCFANGLNKLPELKSTSTRTVTLNSAPDGTYYLNGRTFHSDADEQPKLGSTEDWEIVNLTFEEHPIHLHLVQFQVLDRQQLRINEETFEPDYVQAWNDANGGSFPLQKPAVNPAVAGYVTGDRVGPTGVDTGWKDTVSVPSFTVTRIRVRWTPQDKATFPFVATEGLGYVWHCHMLEHEDNDMMRPLKIAP
jgi:spore coat protein A, manganese oxidase